MNDSRESEEFKINKNQENTEDHEDYIEYSIRVRPVGENENLDFSKVAGIIICVVRDPNDELEN